MVTHQGEFSIAARLPVLGRDHGLVDAGRRLSNTMDPGFCVEALEDALWRYGKPEIFNTDAREPVHQ